MKTTWESFQELTEAKAQHNIEYLACLQLYHKFLGESDLIYSRELVKLIDKVTALRQKIDELKADVDGDEGLRIIVAQLEKLIVESKEVDGPSGGTTLEAESGSTGPTGS